MAKKKIVVEKIDGFKSKTTAVSGGNDSNSFVNVTGASCPTYPYTKASIDAMNQDQLATAYETHITLKKAATTAGTTCLAEWNDLQLYFRNALQKFQANPTPIQTCNASVTLINTATDDNGGAMITPVLENATSYDYYLMPSAKSGTKNAGESISFTGLATGTYEVTIKPKCSNGVTGITKSKSFPVANKSASTSPTTPTTTITTTTTSTPILGGIGGMFGGGGLGQELSDTAAAPKKSNWLFWVLVAGAVYLFTRKKKKD